MSPTSATGTAPAGLLQRRTQRLTMATAIATPKATATASVKGG